MVDLLKLFFYEVIEDPSAGVDFIITEEEVKEVRGRGGGGRERTFTMRV